MRNKCIIIGIMNKAQWTMTGERNPQSVKWTGQFMDRIKLNMGDEINEHME